MNPQSSAEKMTRTTELLKEIENDKKALNILSKEAKKMFPKKVKELKDNILSNQSFLRGRLDALKEEVKFLDKNKDFLWMEECDCPNCKEVLNRLASIQEEIKLIEGVL